MSDEVSDGAVYGPDVDRPGRGIGAGADDGAAGAADEGRNLAWVRRLARLFDVPGDDLDRQVRPGRLEELILGGPRRYTQEELLALAGVDPERATRLWRSMGFAEVDGDEVVFTDADRDALRQLEQLRVTGMVPQDVQEAVTRNVGQAMAAIADWQVEMVHQLIESAPTALDESEILDLGTRVLPMLQKMQDYVWRRHLAAASGRLLSTDHDDHDVRTLVVGFADMVGFTRTTRELTPKELGALIESFQALATEVVGGQRGRVVKTVGDEVLFVADRPANGAEIALRLVERTEPIDTMPELRTGLAVGPVVTRFGDVYGEVVNIAARLTSHARPGRILVDRNMAMALEHDDGYRVRPRRPLSVRGYRHLQPWGLTRA